MPSISDRQGAFAAAALRRRTGAPLALAAAGVASCAWAPPVRAQQQAQGFAVERLAPSAPGGGWFVLDDLNLQGGLGGALSLSLGYAHRPLQVESPSGAQRLPVVQHQAFANVAVAVTYDRFRLHTSFASPLYVSGRSGTVGAWQFQAPSANLEQNPDLVSDLQLGFDARLLGDPGSAARLGAGAQLIFPSGDRADYLTDDTYRAMGRLLFAGDAGRFTTAAHLGVHARPLDDAKVPGSPRGSELLFGAGVGARLPVLGRWIVVGPEIFGATAFRSFFGSETTALEGLLTARLDGEGPAERTVRVKLGVGAGLHPRFGAPQWRAVIGIEVVGHAQPRNGDTASPGDR